MSETISSSQAETGLASNAEVASESLAEKTPAEIPAASAATVTVAAAWAKPAAPARRHANATTAPRPSVKHPGTRISPAAVPDPKAQRSTAMATTRHKRLKGTAGLGGSGACLDTDIGLDLGEFLLAYARDAHEVLRGREWPVRLPVLNDRRRRRLAHAGEPLQLL